MGLNLQEIVSSKPVSNQTLCKTSSTQHRNLNRLYHNSRKDKDIRKYWKNGKASKKYLYQRHVQIDKVPEFKLINPMAKCDHALLVKVYFFQMDCDTADVIVNCSSSSSHIGIVLNESDSILVNTIYCIPKSPETP
uniref:Uncharacterized protein n=1 Tax=Romanomermis culicivorax TaxID=13658 RepID=A0A915KAZ5_ROMCU